MYFENTIRHGETKLAFSSGYSVECQGHQYLVKYFILPKSPFPPSGSQKLVPWPTLWELLSFTVFPSNSVCFDNTVASTLKQTEGRCRDLDRAVVVICIKEALPSLTPHLDTPPYPSRPSSNVPVLTSSQGS